MDQYFEMLAEQNGRCKLCFEPFGDSAGRIPVVDHDHKARKVRGILHSNCNKAVGMFQDSSRICSMAADYLRSFEREESQLKVV